MKIGVWLGYEIKESAGGAFSYTERMIQLIDNHSFPDGIEICFISLLGGGEFNKDIYPLLTLPKGIVQFLKSNSLCYRIAIGLTKRYLKRKGIKKLLEKNSIKLMYYLHQGECLDSNFPFIASNWDIGHRSTHAFPELMWDGKSFEEREYFYRNILPKALMVFCESNAGVDELVQYTNIGLHKLRILPMFGGIVTQQFVAEEDSHRILQEYGLKERQFFFYPAQFWAHKNHVNLIKAFAKFHMDNPSIKLVLSGSDKGNRKYVEHIIEEYELTDHVAFLGFVPIEVMYCMYKHAIALVMASHFGPTNMPPIEAMTIGCPVACSNLGGHHEILGDAAVYFDSYDVNSIEEAIREINSNNVKYRELILHQRSVTNYSETNAMKLLDKHLAEVSMIRMNWV